MIFKSSLNLKRTFVVVETRKGSRLPLVQDAGMMRCILRRTELLCGSSEYCGNGNGKRESLCADAADCACALRLDLRAHSSKAAHRLALSFLISGAALTLRSMCGRPSECGASSADSTASGDSND